MIIGIGNDIIEISRIEKVINRFHEKFLDKIFTPAEQEYCNRYQDRQRRYAGRFAAKEAIVKAMGTGIRDNINWLSIEITNSPEGKPIVTLSPELKHQFNYQILISISHCRDYATAFAVATTVD